MKIREDYTCPLEIVHDFVKGKWKTIILFQLKNGPKSLADLQRGIQGISQKMLIEQLSELKQFGLISKKKAIGYPLAVEYSLSSDKGMRMLEALKIMQQLGIEYMIDKGKGPELIEKGVIPQDILTKK